MKTNEITDRSTVQEAFNNPTLQSLARTFGFKQTAANMQQNRTAEIYKNNFFAQLSPLVKSKAIDTEQDIAAFTQDYVNKTLKMYGGFSSTLIPKIQDTINKFAAAYKNNPRSSTAVFDQLANLVGAAVETSTYQRTGKSNKKRKRANALPGAATTQPAPQTTAQPQPTSNLNNFTATLANTVTTPGLAGVALGFAVRHALNLGLTSTQIEQSVEQALRNTPKP